MRRALLISGVAAGIALAITAGVTAYAVYNLTALIARNHRRILTRLSDALGRPVEVGRIQARVGLGLSIEVDGLKIADDPAFSSEPFLSVEQASLDVQFVPLLHGNVKVHRLNLVKLNVRILKKADGRFNVGTLGGGDNTGPLGAPSRHRLKGGGRLRGVLWAAVEDVSIKSLGVEDGTVYYNDATLGGVPLLISHLSTEMTGFHTGRPFGLDLKCALFSDPPNIALSGKMGPMLRQGVFDVPNCPLDLKFTAGPVVLDSMRTLLAPGSVIPVAFSIPGPLSVTGTLTGSLAQTAIAASTNLSNYRVVYRAASNQHGEPPLTLEVSGRNAIRGTLRLLEKHPGKDLTATMTQVNLKFEGAQLPAISDLNATIHMAPRRVTVEPASFTVGTGHARFDASADSLSPLKAAFTFQADSLQLSSIVPSRPSGEFLNQLAVSGTAGGELSAPVVNARIKSASGLVEQLAYRNLDVTGRYAGNQVSAQPLSMDAFEGSVLGNINAVLAARPPFNASLSLKHINLSDALRWQDVRTNAISGFLTGNVRISATGATWGEIEPTMRGSGRVFLSGGTLQGVNIVGIAINKIAAAPVVSQLVNAAFRTSHEGLLTASSTDLRQASMTFTLAGPRVTTPDLLIRSPDYEITGDGWFDFDKNISMTGDIKLTLGLSAAIPVVVMGKYPSLLVLPNIPTLAGRVAIGAVNAPVNVLKEGVKGLGSVFGGVRSLLP